MARGLKFLILEVKGLYYLCSENNGTGQLCGLRAADLQLCFCICKTGFFHDAALFESYEFVIFTLMDTAAQIMKCFIFNLIRPSRVLI